MKNLNSFFIMTAEKEKDLIPLSEVAEKECGLLALSDGKGGLTHFMFEQKTVFAVSCLKCAAVGVLNVTAGFCSLILTGIRRFAM